MSTSGDAQAQPGRLRRLGGWARQAPVKRIGGPVAAAALAVSGAFGGLEPVPASYDEATAGEVVHSGPFEVSVDRVRAIDHLRPVFSPEDGNRFLVVVLDVRNPTDEPVYAVLLSNELEVDPTGATIDPDTRPMTVSMKDFSSLSLIQPGIDYEIGIVYETKGDAVPSDVRIGVPGYTWREDSFTPGLFEWKDPETVARGTFAVKDVPDEPEDETR